MRQSYTNNYGQSNQHFQDDSQSEQHADEQGFQQQMGQQELIFRLKEIDLKDKKFDIKRESIRCFAISELCIIIVSQNNKLYRWVYGRDNDQFVEYSLPARQDESNIMGLLSFAKKAILGGDQKKKGEIAIDKLFLDTKGYHCILSNTNGQNYYFHLNDSRIRPVYKIHGVVIKSIGFDDLTTEETTKQIILGDDEGHIVIWKINIQLKKNELQIDEEKPELILTLPNELPIIHIQKLILSQQYGNQSGQRNIMVIVSTSSFNYCFFGLNDLNSVFQKYSEDKEKIQQAEVPMGRSHTSLLDICYKKQDNRPHSMIWTNGKFLANFKFPERDQAVNQSFLMSYQFFRYAKKKDEKEKEKELEVKEMPVGIGLTEFHYYILHQDSITIMSRITEQVVESYDLKEDMQGPAIGMIYDKALESFWIYSAKRCKRLETSNEDKEAWKLYMDKKQYKEAYHICEKYDQENQFYIGGLYADELFEKNQYIEAAECYFKVRRNFEEIFLKFLYKSKQLEYQDSYLQEGLEIYLNKWVQYYNTSAHKAQQTIIFSWLVELKLHRLNSFERKLKILITNYEKDIKKNSDQSQKIDIMYNQWGSKDQKKSQQNHEQKQKEIQQQLQLEEDRFISFVQNIKDENLIQIINQIMQSHGRLKNIVELALKNNNFETMIIHYINDENYGEAIDQLEKIKDEKDKDQNKRFTEILFKYCHIFMQHKPKETCALLKKKINKKFNFSKLIGGLMNIPKIQRDEGINFLQHCIKEQECKDKSIHNILIFFLSDNPNPNSSQKLNKFLSEQEEKLKEKNQSLNFDLYFAVRLFDRNNQPEAQIKVFGMMGLYEEAVTLALQKNFIDKAKDNAQKPANSDDKKKLWLKIAIYLLGKEQENNIEDVIKLSKETDLIKIEDLLPHFNANIKIEHFKDQICESLSKYNEDISQLRGQMEAYSKNAEQLKNELRNIKNKYIEIDTNKTCEECFQSMFFSEFYIFPCMHGFHKDCIMKKLKTSHDKKSQKFEEISTLNKQIEFLISKIKKNEKNFNQQSSGFFSFANLFGGSNSEDRQKETGLTKSEEEQLKKWKEQFDNKIASECMYCGPSIVDSIFATFDDENKDSWKL